MTIRKKLCGTSVPVPCGKCPKCVAKRGSAWSFRLMQEDKISETAIFVTLTYNTDHVPITNNGFMNLSKEDITNFFKRLRKNQQQKHPSHPKIKYYAVGEYGGKSSRPHYHIILFNCADPILIEQAWRLNDKPIGEIHLGKVEQASVGYTLKYISKPRTIPIHNRDDRQKEFAHMSKGLGANYVNDEIKNWHLTDLDNRMYVNTNEGKKVSMPRYYKDRIYTEEQRKRIAFLNKIEAEKNLLEKPLTAIDTRNQIESHKALFKKQKNKPNNDKI